jgi:hypothetical protein
MKNGPYIIHTHIIKNVILINQITQCLCVRGGGGGGGDIRFRACSDRGGLRGIEGI